LLVGEPREAAIGDHAVFGGEVEAARAGLVARRPAL
jgi:hypothetical protein